MFRWSIRVQQVIQLPSSQPGGTSMTATPRSVMNFSNRIIDSFENLAKGLETCVWMLAGVPRQYRTDHLSAAIHPVDAEGRERARELRPLPTTPLPPSREVHVGEPATVGRLVLCNALGSGQARLAEHAAPKTRREAGSHPCSAHPLLRRDN